MCIIEHIMPIHRTSAREAFQSKKRGNLVNGPNRVGGVAKKSKKSQLSVGESSKLRVVSEIKKVPSTRGYQRLKNITFDQLLY